MQVAGGGAVEAALSIYLESFATTLGTREQLAIHEFSQALLVIPKTLAVNAALDATEVVSQLCVFHNTAQKVVRMRAEGRMRAGRVCVLLLLLLLLREALLVRFHFRWCVDG